MKQPIYVKKYFTHYDNVLNRYVDYAEIQISEPMTINGVHFKMTYTYDTPSSRLDDKRFYKLPFKDSNINFRVMHDKYNQARKESWKHA